MGRAVESEVLASLSINPDGLPVGFFPHAWITSEATPEQAQFVKALMALARKMAQQVEEA